MENELEVIELTYKDNTTNEMFTEEELQAFIEKHRYRNKNGHWIAGYIYCPYVPLQ